MRALAWIYRACALVFFGALGCQSILGIESAQELVACLKDSDCTNSTCVDFKCVVACLSADCAMADAACESSSCRSDMGLVDVSIAAPRDAEAASDNAASDSQELANADVSAEADAAPDARSTPSIVIALPGTLCSDQPAQIAVSVTGGVAPYIWSLEGPGASTFSLATDSPSMQSDRATVVGRAKNPGSYSFTLLVRDGDGHTVRRDVTWEVRETPSVTSLGSQASCQSAPYNTELSATGGDASGYTWKADFGGQAGLQLVGNAVSGVLPATGSLAYSVSVSDGYCASPDTSITVTLAETGFGACPNIGPLFLPTPCNGAAYRAAEFKASGGTGPFTWKALSAPPGLSFDPSSRELSGTSLGAGELTLEIVDAHGARARRTYAMTPRDKCWLAYASSEMGANRLHLFDPIVAAPPLGFPNIGGGGGSVQDFKFSPDGKFLAFRLTLPGGVESMHLLEAPTWTEQVIDISGSFSQYVWSPDSKVLAMAYKQGTDLFLGGVNVTGATVVTGDAGANSIVGIRNLMPVAAAPRSDLVWLDTEHVAFALTQNEVDGPLPYYVTLMNDGFASLKTPSLGNAFGNPFVIFPASVGFFLVSGGPELSYIGIGNHSTFIPYRDGQLLDPAGLFVVGTQGSDLRLFDTTHRGSPPTVATGLGCGRVLAWARGKERLACVTDPVDAGSPLGTQGTHTAWMFDIEPTGPSFLSQDIRGSYAYTEGTSFERRRAFSPSGNWFAMTTNDHLYVINDTNQTPQLWINYDASDQEGHDGELSFSPGEDFLIWHKGSHMALANLRQQGGTPEWLSVDPFAPPAGCSESFLDHPATYCGNGFGSPTIAWSSDSRMAAAKMATGALRAWDLHPSGRVLFESVEACAGACSAQFGFQP